MLAIFNRHKSLTIVGSVAILLVVISFNVYYVTAPQIVSDGEMLTESEIDRTLPGYVPNPNSSNSNIAQTTPLNYIPIAVTGVVLVVGAIGIIIAVKISDKNQVKQDSLYREQLSELAASFEAYAVAKGNYPKSSTYSSEHYTGIHLGKEWLDYGFPSDSEMKHFNQNWPIVPTDKIDKILYYVRDNGARFDLFSQIKTLPKDEAKDYNREFELPKAWGEFNYYIPSRGIAVQPTPLSTPEIQAAAPEENLIASPEPSPITLNPATPTQVIPAQTTAVDQPIQTPSPPFVQPVLTTPDSISPTISTDAPTTPAIALAPSVTPSQPPLEPVLAPAIPPIRPVSSTDNQSSSTEETARETPQS